MLYGFMLGKRTMDVFFVVRKLQKEYLQKDKRVVLVFCIPEEGFNRVPKKVVEWSLRKKDYQR